MNGIGKEKNIDENESSSPAKTKMKNNEPNLLFYFFTIVIMQVHKAISN